MKLFDTISTSMKKSIAGFFERNGGVIASALCLAVFAAVGREMGLIKDDEKKPIPAPKKDPDDENENSPFHLKGPSNSYEAAMVSFWRHGITARIESAKIDAAKNVRDMITGNDVTEQTKAYAIKVVEKIGQTMRSDYNRNILDKLVREIAMKPSVVPKPEKPVTKEEPEIEAEFDTDE